MGRKKSRNATQILRAVNPIPGQRGNPRKWGPGGKRSYGHEVPVGRVPRRRFGDFAAAGKVTRRPQAAKSPCKKRNCSIIAPSSVWPDGQPPSPRGKALCGGAALIRPRGKAYNGRRRNAVSHKILLLTFLLRKVSRWSSLPPEFSHPAPAALWTSGPPLSAWSAHPQCCGS